MIENKVLESDFARIDDGFLDKKKLDGSTIIITGCAGFLGGYLIQYLVSRKESLNIQKIIGLDTFLFGKPAWLENILNRNLDYFEVAKFDISKEEILKFKGESEIVYFIHAASIASPTFYRKYPIETIDANIWGLRNILNSFTNQNSLKGLLFFSSSEIYGDPGNDNIPTDEEYRGHVSCIGPRSCYDESKRFGETLSWIYGTKLNMPVTVVRPFNNYGPGMSKSDRRLPADLANSIISNQDILLYSDGSPTRSFCYISDAIVGYLQALVYGRYDYFNIGSSFEEISVLELSKLYSKIGKKYFGYQGNIIKKISEDVEYLTDNPLRRAPSIKKAKEKLNYFPIINLEKGIYNYLAYLREEK